MTRLGTSLVDCGQADQCAETPIAPNEMAAIQTDGCFIGILNRSAGNRRAVAADAPASGVARQTSADVRGVPLALLIWARRITEPTRCRARHARECPRR